MREKKTCLFEIEYISSSGLFDVSYYSSQANICDTHKIEKLIKHYLEFGQHQGFSPSPKFDQFKYQNSLGYKLANRGLSPFSHALIHGSIGVKSVGVYIHAYYIDVFEEILCATLTIKESKVYYVSVFDEESLNLARLIVTKYGFSINRDVYIFQCENRGRNFGPFLFKFKDFLLRHDIILHLHTKKSLRTGSEQSGWRMHSWYSLCGTEAISSSIITELRQGSQIGLVGPAASDAHSSYWWRRWLSVGHLIRPYFKKLKILDFQRKGVLNFPIGGMFWARTEALAPLLMAEWTVDDFEAEPLPDDGTLAHVIERSLGTICECSGYTYKESLVQDDFHRLVSPPDLLADYIKIVQGIDISSDLKCVSYDFFDTLFTRSTFLPADVFEYMGFVIEKNFKLDGANFKNYRENAEALARTKNINGEVNIYEIYDCFHEVAPWPQDVVRFSLNLEFSIEERLLVPRHDILNKAKLAKENGCTLIIISDTYLPSSFLEKILIMNGCGKLFDAILVSCELRLRKDWGNMWDHIRARYADYIDMNHYLHIGDNEQSDIQQTVRRGIRSIGVLNPVDILDHYQFSGPNGWKFGKSNWHQGILMGPISSKYANSPFIKDLPFFRNSFDFGFCVLGPILFGFNSWLVKNAIENQSGINVYQFFSRDGFFLKELYDTVAVMSPSLNLPKSNYFMVSRRAVLSCLFDTRDSLNDQQRIALLLTGNFKGSVNEFFENRMGYHVSHNNKNFNKKMLLNHEFVAQVLAEEADSIVKYCASSKENFITYQSTSGMHNDKSAIVDVGYSCTIQKIIQIISEENLNGLYMALGKDASNLNEFGLGGAAKAFFGDSRDPDSTMSYFQAYSLVIESFLTAFHGQIHSYGSSGPLLDSIVENNSRRNFLTESFNGAVDYVKCLINSYGEDVSLIPFTGDDCLINFVDFINGRIEATHEVEKNFLVEDSFSGNGILNSMSVYHLNG